MAACRHMGRSPEHANQWLSLLYVLALLAPMIALTYVGVFDSALVEVGLAHYAEGRRYMNANTTGTAGAATLTFLPMPANTLVNAGYVAVGIIWLLFIHYQQHSLVFSERDKRMFQVFNWMSICYGAIQTARILLQNPRLAVLDQWATLPFFAWVINWSAHICDEPTNGQMIFVTLTSILSYGLVLLSDIGFEVALGLNILFACIYGVRVMLQFRTEATRNAFSLALLSCSGFVVLKLLDHHLASVNPIFELISGHFMSKIADVLQIHYVNKFFCHANMQKTLRNKVNK